MEQLKIFIMKNLFYLLLSFFLFFSLNSCNNDDFEVSELDETTVNLKSDKNKALENFGFAFMKCIKQSPKLRKLIKNEALKMFNKDYEVLVYRIIDIELENGKTFEKFINDNTEDEFKLSDLLKIEPTLTILVPELPFKSFSAKLWNAANEIPAIAIRTNTSNKIPMITPDGELGIIPSDAIPGFPVLVIKNNERVISSTQYSNFRNLETNTILEKNGVTLKFWSNNFDKDEKN